jgi:hypothetical protein
MTGVMLTVVLIASCVACGARSAVTLDHEIERIGAPVPGALPVGRLRTSGGDALCIDACTARTQGYAPSGSLRAFMANASQLLRDRGYAVTTSGCVVEGPGIVATGTYELDCYVTGRRAGLLASIAVLTHLTRPIATPECPTPTSQCNIASLPSNITLDRSRGDSMDVAVTSAGH